MSSTRFSPPFLTGLVEEIILSDETPTGPSSGSSSWSRTQRNASLNCAEE